MPGQSESQAEFREPDWLYESQLGSQQEARIKIEDTTTGDEVLGTEITWREPGIQQENEQQRAEL